MNLTTIHPVTYLLYYFVLILFALLFNNIYYIATFLIFTFILLILQGAKSKIGTTLKYFIPVSLIIIIINPMFSHVGTTEIFLFNNFYITLESLVYGIIMAFSLLIIFILFLSFNEYFNYQQLLYVSSKHFPSISMIGVMTMRFIPLLNNRLEEVNKIFTFNDNSKNTSRFDKIVNMGSIVAIVIAWSLEESMLTARSMRARGYGVTKRTNYLHYDINQIDIIFIILVVITGIVSLIGLFYGFGEVNIYPTLSSSFFEFNLNIFYLTFIILLLPFIILEIRERFIWKFKGENSGIN
jgi:energy-coupling factor transport system permease protein